MEDTRRRIVEATVGLMQREPYDAVQMRDVVKAADVAIATVYRHFGSKDHLLAAALLAWSERFPDDVRRSASSDATSLDEVKASYGRAVRSFARYPSVYTHLDALRTTGDADARTLYKQFADRQHDAFGVSLRRLRPERRTRIVAVMDAVLDTNLREWSVGNKPIEEVLAAVDSAAELLLD